VSFGLPFQVYENHVLTTILLHMARLERGMEMHDSSVICLFLTLRVKSLV